jgi:outer membrane protein OmpA-like peptidoglycan-associated protein
MIRRIVLSLVVLVLTGGLTMAADLGFEDTAEGMANRLLAPANTSGAKMRGLGGSVGARVRGLTIVEKVPGQQTVVEKTMVAPKEKAGGYVNLAVRFDVNSFAIRSESIPLLDELGKALGLPGVRDLSVVVNGHTDSDGGEGYNLRLSLNRAMAVKQYLVNNHVVPPIRLKVMGYGEGLPLVANTSASNKQLNRRVEIVATN